MRQSARKKSVPEAARKFFRENPKVHQILKNSSSIQDARTKLFEMIYGHERKIRSLQLSYHPLLNVMSTDAMYILRTILSKRSEKLTGISSLKILRNTAIGKHHGASEGFFEEFRHLFFAVNGKARIYGEARQNLSKDLKGREAALSRSKELDYLAKKTKECMDRYRSGLEKEIIARRKDNVRRILKHFDASESDWADYNWHFKNVVKDPDTLAALVDLPDETVETVRKAVNNRVPFGATPYYISLFDNQEPRYDLAVRLQVLLPPDYVDFMVDCKDRKTDLDFMGEHDTSPCDLITRRYPNILILKPYNACPQVCTYCQRNWEIDEVMAPGATAPKDKMENAISWIENDEAITEVLITGGDPFVLTDEHLDELLGRISRIEHVKNIRLGTRTLVTIPFRITDSLIGILKKYLKPGELRICIVTHFENTYEITPEAAEACAKIRNAGISIYNQMVYTLPNSRRFEACKLRETIRLVGIDPYYTFNTKGHREMNMLRVPIARLLQEQKEESRLFPGLNRTDEAVFNVPRLGKNHLRAKQDHNVLMIAPDGRRLYVFHPWEKNITIKDPYIIDDVPIMEYLERLEKMGEDINDYQSIWYYY
ncbi:MAG: KamA family radical SAM protein [Planctomycetota bacterium]|jgi:lysine 2,3-aminomutase